MRTLWTIGILLATNLIIAQGRFDFTDNDGDWIEDSWEELNGLSSTTLADAYDDLDGDGLANIYEYYLDTDPNNAEDPASAAIGAGEDITDLIEDNINNVLHVKLSEGNYLSSIFQFNKTDINVIVTGGWDPGFTFRDVEQYTSTFNNGNEAFSLTVNGGENTIILDGVTTANEAFLGYGMPVSADGGENFIGVNNCIFNGPSGSLKFSSSSNSQNRVLFHHNLVNTSDYKGVDIFTNDDSHLDMRMYHCTIADQVETSILQGSGIYISNFGTSTGQIDIKNSIIYGNENTGVEAFADHILKLNIDHCIMQLQNDFFGDLLDYTLDAESIMYLDPKFEENYSLSNLSEAIDFGVDIGFPYEGLGPDLGYDESPFSTNIVDLPFEDQASFFPNPLTSTSLVTKEKFDLARIYSLDGKLIQESKGNGSSIFIPDTFDNGIYFLHLQVGDQLTIKKLMISRI